MREILDILEKNAKITIEEIAAMTGRSVGEIAGLIDEYEKNKVILGYRTVVDWDRTEREFVSALIEVRLTPQRDKGFDSISSRIYKFPQVKTCYLMSGGYDLVVFVEGRNLKEVALFVAEKLSVIDGVLSTATHFVLKKYKDGNMLFDNGESDDREAIVL
jgi:DNA-binding Lrp family transcriptional regulator